MNIGLACELAKRLAENRSRLGSRTNWIYNYQSYVYCVRSEKRRKYDKAKTENSIDKVIIDPVGKLSWTTISSLYHDRG